MKKEIYDEERADIAAGVAAGTIDAKGEKALLADLDERRDAAAAWKAAHPAPNPCTVCTAQDCKGCEHNDDEEEEEDRKGA